MSGLAHLRRELLISFVVLFTGGLLVALLGLIFLLPALSSPGEAVLYVLVLLSADLVVVFLFGRAILGRTLLRPLSHLVDDVKTIASGRYEHRVGADQARDLQPLADSVNGLAERLIQDRVLLAENVRSLDDTNRQLIEARAQVVRAARLASAGTLASGIAHEVGNPLGAILAYVDVARSRAGAEGRETEILDSVREEALRIDRIIRSLLDFARSEERETLPQDPWPVVKKVRDLLDAQGRLEGVQTKWESVGDIPKVLVDAQRLEQVVLNLLLNALEAVEGVESKAIGVILRVEEGPAVAFPARRSSDPPGVNYSHRRRVAGDAEPRRLIPLATAEAVVTLSVEDNGPGLDPEHFESVFDPFFTTKEPGKGTGLGLALSAQLVEGMGGEIEVGNRAGVGAVFTVRLPGLPEALAGLPEPENVDEEGGRS
jgi:signal transduction histidine kinase